MFILLETVMKLKLINQENKFDNQKYVKIIDSTIV
jgi:hypothetical protein